MQWLITMVMIRYNKLTNPKKAIRHVAQSIIFLYECCCCESRLLMHCIIWRVISKHTLGRELTVFIFLIPHKTMHRWCQGLSYLLRCSCKLAGMWMWLIAEMYTLMVALEMFPVAKWEVNSSIIDSIVGVWEIFANVWKWKYFCFPAWYVVLVTRG